MKLHNYSFGVGDRFGRQGKAQLAAFLKARESGLDIVPVWNKSFREHAIIGTTPMDVRREADSVTRDARWPLPYYVDADHINLSNVEDFLKASDFFTLDVADYTGKRAEATDIDGFVARFDSLCGTLDLGAGGAPLHITRDTLREIAAKYLLAVREAGRIYRYVAEHKGEGMFVTEVSMDETSDPQTPQELLVILAAIADEGIPAQTIAPKFSGAFHKGVDYIGDPPAFAREFADDLAVIRYAVGEFGLPDDLKLSVHSGSDKFSIYPLMRQALRESGAGLHLKTAGTTWLEELIGLAAAGGEGLDIAQTVYGEAFARLNELCAPYASVIAIDKALLPAPETVRAWSSEQFVLALRHDPSCPHYNRELRQLLHVGYKVAAEMGGTYLDALATFEDSIAENVTDNLLTRHITPIFGGTA